MKYKADLRPPKKVKPKHGEQKMRGGYRENAGRPLGAATKPYNVLFYLKRSDLIEAVAVVNEKIKKDRDFSAAVYIINQACGTPINRKENVGPQDAGNRVVIILPQKESEFRLQGAEMIELPEKSSGESARMERLLGITHLTPRKASDKGQSTSAGGNRPGKTAK